MILVIRDCEDGKIYGVLEFVNALDRMTAMNIIENVRNNIEWWSMEDVWQALEDSDLEYAKYNDIDEYYI